MEHGLTTAERRFLTRKHESFLRIDFSEKWYDKHFFTILFVIGLFTISLLVHILVEPPQAQAAQSPESIRGITVIGATHSQIKSFCAGV